MTKKLVSFDDQAEPGEGLPAAVKAELNATYAQGELAGRFVTGMKVTTPATTPRAIDRDGDRVWGHRGGRILWTEDGVTWTDHCAGPGAQRFFRCPDGEMLAVGNATIQRSTGFASGSPTWATVHTVHGAAMFTGFSVEGHGNKFIAAQYSGMGTRPDSRYVHASLDGGLTWTQIWDSVDRFGQAAADASHLHGVAYDPWSDRWYVAEGHGAGVAGIYSSPATLSPTWTLAPGMVLDPAPMTLTPTDDGLVCGSDSGIGGTLGVLRHSDPALEAARFTMPWATGNTGSATMATRAVRDPDTGQVWVGFYTTPSGGKPIIVSARASSATKAWEWNGPATSAGAQIQDCVPVAGKLLATMLNGGTVTSLHGELTRSVPGGATPPDVGNVMGGTAVDGSALAIGALSRATIAGTTAIGVGAQVTAALALALGRQATASGEAAIAIGAQANAAGLRSFTMGYQATTGDAANANAMAMGYQAQAGASGAMAFGHLSKALNSQATALGYQAQVTANNGTAVGVNARVSGAGSLAFGVNTNVIHNSSVGLGSHSTAHSQVQFGARHLAVQKISSLSPAQANEVSLAVVDNGSGKLQLQARFPTGAAQILATEP